uniref:Uncharacterized protein n=1 Tax=Timema poppense TaxID=170557 RepID=A0A7R9DJV1_TIMPO|nr:unnamed protein product [Timema poppensis]
MSQFHSVISPAAMNALQKYLAKENNIILLQLLHTWFNFEIMLHHYVLEQEEEPLLERKLDEKSDKLAMIHNTEYSEIQEMLKLKETIQWTQVNPIPLGPLKLYTLQNNGCKIGCAYISPSREQLAAGLKNEIKLWNLTPKRFLVTAPRRIHLACDPPSPPTDPQTFL